MLNTALWCILIRIIVLIWKTCTKFRFWVIMLYVNLRHFNQWLQLSILTTNYLCKVICVKGRNNFLYLENFKPFISLKYKSI